MADGKTNLVLHNHRHSDSCPLRTLRKMVAVPLDSVSLSQPWSRNASCFHPLQHIHISDIPTMHIYINLAWKNITNIKNNITHRAWYVNLGILRSYLWPTFFHFRVSPLCCRRVLFGGHDVRRGHRRHHHHHLQCSMSTPCAVSFVFPFVCQQRIKLRRRLRSSENKHHKGRDDSG